MKLAFKHAVAAIILVLSFAAPVAAGSYEDFLAADAAYDKNDYATALRLYRLLANKHYVAAQERLGTMYDIGLGVSKNYAEALKWYRLAADQGLAVAQADLGVMYEQGHGVTQDYVQAHMWYNLAAAQGVPILHAEKYRDEVAKHMTPAQIAEAQKLAREWKPTKQQAR